MAGYKKNSPANFMPTFSQIGAVAKGIKNRDEYGGGLKGAIKGTFGEFTGETEKNRFENIDNKLDTIIQNMSQNTDPVNSASDPAATPFNQPQDQGLGTPMAMASPAKFTEFMTTHQQAPVSNNTGGKNPTFNPRHADRMMAVADPNVDTKGALFMTKPGADDKLVKVTDEGVKAGNLKVTPVVEAKGTDQVTGYKKNKAGVKVNLANLPVNFKVGFDQKNTGYKSSITPSFQIGAKFKIPSGKKQQKPKFT